MDYFMFGAKPPAASHGTLLLGSEFECLTGAYAKSEKHILMLGEQRVAINLGIMWAQHGSPLLVEAERKARALWQKNKPFNKDRYLDHQRMIQKEFAKSKKAEVMDPILTSPFPRWNEK